MMLDTTILRKLRTAALLLLLTLTVGMAGFYYLEGYSLVDSFYMTIITVSTVGYGILGDAELSDPGKIFVSFLVIFSIGMFIYVINTLTTFVVEGEIQGFLKGYRVNKEIKKLRNHVIICGLGRNGSQAARELEHDGENFVIIERDIDVVKHYLEQHPEWLILQGDATEETILEMAQLSHAKGVISALADDASNVYVTLTIRQLNPKVSVVARAANESTISKLRIAGANRVILPNILGGRKMARIMTKPALVDFVDLISGQGKFHMQLDQIDCVPSSKLVGKTLKELDIRSRTGVMVLGTQLPDGRFELNPRADLVIQVGEKLFVIGTQAQMEEFQRVFG